MHTRCGLAGPGSEQQALSDHECRCAELTVRSSRGRWILVATVLGSGVAFLDGSIVNVALPRIQRDLNTSLGDLQWILDAYLLTLGSLLLVGGALGDQLGRRRVFVAGLLGFGVASVACGLAPNPAALILARAAQGVAGALLVPGSLAIIAASFRGVERARAIGAWSGLAGVATALGPFVGGYLIDAASWRWAFLINVPLIAAAVVTTVRHVPETRADRTAHRLDLAGAGTAVLGLGLFVFPLIEAGSLSGAAIAGLMAAGVLVLVGFVVIEARSPAPMLPLELFRIRPFTVANIVTFAVYGGLGGALFLVSLELQFELGYSALQAGAAFLPLTLLLFLLSPRVGAAVPKVGARLPLTVGPLLSAGGLLLFVRVQPGATYVGSVLPAILLFALGMCLVVAPVTETALGSIDEARTGIASGVNNAVARIAGLIAVAVLPLVAGLSADPTSSAAFTDGFHQAMLIAAGCLVAGSLAAAVGLRGRQLPEPSVRVRPDTVPA